MLQKTEIIAAENSFFRIFQITFYQNFCLFLFYVDAFFSVKDLKPIASIFFEIWGFKDQISAKLNNAISYIRVGSKNFRRSLINMHEFSDVTVPLSFLHNPVIIKTDQEVGHHAWSYLTNYLSLSLFWQRLRKMPANTRDRSSSF